MEISKLIVEKNQPIQVTLKCQFCAAVQHTEVVNASNLFTKEIVPGMSCVECGKSTEGATND